MCVISFCTYILHFLLILSYTFTSVYITLDHSVSCHIYTSLYEYIYNLYGGFLKLRLPHILYRGSPVGSQVVAFRTSSLEKAARKRWKLDTVNEAQLLPGVEGIQRPHRDMRYEITGNLIGNLKKGSQAGNMIGNIMAGWWFGTCFIFRYKYWE